MYQDYSPEKFSVGSVSDSTFGHHELLIISAWWIGMDNFAERPHGQAVFGSLGDIFNGTH